MATSNNLNTKPHYPVLDGLRGVAALMVVAFHVFEANAKSTLEQVINHGYLAVDFFFALSGFVIGYAYDDRWGKLSIGGFFKRRLVRLQPMVIMGMAIGAVCFYFSASSLWPGIPNIPVWQVIGIMLIGFTLLPVPVTMDIRGWHEMHPLNGPGWSLFYEYIANILYAIGIRKLPRGWLLALVIIAGAALTHYLVTGKSGDVIGGWSLEPEQIRIGITRVLYPFLAGLLLFRVAKPKNRGNMFLLCSILLVALLAMPRIGGNETRYLNGLYESATIIIMFPLIVYLGTCGSLTGGIEARISKFLGDISYPIYITHYPLIYIYTGWVIDNKAQNTSMAAIYGLLTFVASVVIAYATLKLYDEPVRTWLGKRFSSSA